ncbi:MAG: BBP7 family outer membrane beta-barrel protein, partial [Planctomycetota bacterium]
DQDGRLDDPADTFGDVFALGFGSVAVNFEAPDGYFAGFRDYLINSFPGAGVVFGPKYEITNYGSEEDGILEDEVAVVGGIADDLNGNGFTFEVLLGDLNGDGDIEDDEIIGSFIDYGDLFEFNIYFEDITVRNVTSMDGIELMGTHQINTSHRLERGRNDSLEISYGLRYLEMQDMFSWDARGSILGRTGATVEMDNQIIGPQIGLTWTRHDGPWDFYADGRFMFGYNRTDRDLNGIFGQEAIPGALNNSINARTTTTVTGDTRDEFSPLGELRIGARYRFSRAIAVSVGYTGKFIDNIERAAPAMRYTAPNFSLQSGRGDLIVNGWNAGVELRY